MKYTKDYYLILNVKPNATSTEIRRAYRLLAILYHPDRNPTRESNTRMQEINEAYSVIGNQSRRAEYNFQYLNSFSASPIRNPHPYNQKRTSSRSQHFFVWGAILSSSFFIIPIIIMMFPGVGSISRVGTIFISQFIETPRDVIFFRDETTFIANHSTIGPIDAPISEELSSAITIQKYGLTINPGADVSSIAVINLNYTSFPRGIWAVSPYSDLNFEFAKNITGFGFSIYNETDDGYVGNSNFVGILKKGNIPVETVRFLTPANGVVFVAFVSKTPFNRITLMEMADDAGNQSGSDREAFGNFYIVP